MAQDAQIVVRLPGELAAEIRARAEQEGVKPSVVVRRALRAMIKGDRARTSTERQAIDGIRIELQAIGRNLNQLTRHANRAELGQGPAPAADAIAATVDLVNDVVRRTYKLLRD